MTINLPEKHLPEKHLPEKRIPEKRINARHNRRPVFVARVPFHSYDDIPEDLGQNDSPISAHGLRVSEQDYWEKYYEVSDYHYEWNNGILEEKPVSDYVTFKLYKWLFLLIEAFLTTRPIGKLVALETGFRMSFPQQKRVTIRKYYILDAKKEYMTFYRRGSDGRYARIPISKDGIVRCDVLPGLQFRVADLFRQPSLFLLTDDPVYRDFVLPEVAELKNACTTSATTC